MLYVNQYEKWMNNHAIDEETKRELVDLKGNEIELKDRFSFMLDFGTAGLRGKMGAGLNRMNIYTVRYATQALSDLIVEKGEEAAKRGVCIAYDSRLLSEEFAWEAACTLSANGVAVHIFDELRPTPELSFSIRELGAIAGINITASHNPKEYNGYKVYWEDGAQLPPQHAKQISERLKQIDIFADVKTYSKDEALKSGLISVVGKELDDQYLTKVLAESVGKRYVDQAASNFRIIYSPIHGTGYRLVPEALQRLGIQHLLTVPEQMMPDGHFPTTKSPNPEDKEALQLAIKMAEKEDVDVIVGTDPDADRVGVVVRNHKGEFISLTGNQIGVLLADYLLQIRKNNGTLPDNAVIIKSIVSTDMVKKIAESYNIQVLDVLTGFKFIGEKMKEFEETNEYSFIFGFEESNGYLAGTYARDKDAIVATVLIAEMACYYYLKNMTLYDALCNLYKEYGYFDEQCVSITIDGVHGIEMIQSITKSLRTDPPMKFANIPVIKRKDYQTSKIENLQTGKEEVINLPQAEVLAYELEDGSSIIVRPSGTEPKLKIYIMVKAESREAVLKKKEELAVASKSLIGKLSEHDVYR
ncbi:MAG: phospho-sugar mutase [Bacillus sp. (in: firmicutes)]